MQLNGTSLEAISRYDMARKIPVGGSITFQELADQCGLYEPDVRRIVRFAIAPHFVANLTRALWLTAQPLVAWLTPKARETGLELCSMIATRVLGGYVDFLFFLISSMCCTNFWQTIEAIEQYISQDTDKTVSCL